jgi:DNA-binding transcriptional LysR family regulator
MLETRALRLFIALAEERHFGRTAERLGVAQSVLSVQLRRLEDAVGTPLLTRGRRAAVTLTRAGTIFLEEARGSIERLDQAERIGRLAGRGEAGPIRIGYVFSAAMCGLLARALRALGERLPLIEATPVLMETPEQLQAVADGRIDFGLVRPRPLYPAGIETHQLHREGLTLALAGDHPLTAAPHVAAGALAAERFILPQFHEQVGLVDTLAALARFGGFEPGQLIRTNDFVTAVSMAAAGQGVALVPRSLASLALPHVAYRQVEGFAETVDLVLAFRSDTLLTGAAAVLRGLSEGA